LRVVDAFLREFEKERSRAEAEKEHFSEGGMHSKTEKVQLGHKSRRRYNIMRPYCTDFERPYSCFIGTEIEEAVQHIFEAKRARFSKVVLLFLAQKSRHSV
jgi:hypothetical protein